ncbi:hypothetical protein EYF80_010084 [Liparis tanakae]|uniref:Uncharacterized protein n=1 Tax=Liparis tanakae TaxID=230148 RepID=A0A4Z2INW4_9TELE|nr:hypothetical protein EYF80_010084 [Liparis tanakae]
MRGPRTCQDNRESVGGAFIVGRREVSADDAAPRRELMTCNKCDICPRSWTRVFHAEGRMS